MTALQHSLIAEFRNQVMAVDRLFPLKDVNLQNKDTNCLEANKTD